MLLPKDSGYREILEDRIFYPDRDQLEREVAEGLSVSTQALGDVGEALYDMILEGEPGIRVMPYDELRTEWAAQFASSYE